MAIDVTAKADLTALLARARQTAQLLDEMGLESDRQTVEELIIALGGNLDEDNIKETPAPAVAPEPQPLPKAPASANERDYYTTTEAARLIGVSAQTIRNWVERDMIKAYRLGGRTAIPRSEVDGYLPLAESLRYDESWPTPEFVREATQRDPNRRRPWDSPVSHETADTTGKPKE